ncbi:uncharacterized protein LOC129229734 [Uloborus diversus]|uniref:uncharacterized protein LOC129229734 n=1 Tax=Uloborus diversus TaxID=327109 RepID=UPI002409CC69|nr:uncharacterized protein LOC129229734 [Uloborus diversus]
MQHPVCTNPAGLAGKFLPSNPFNLNQSFLESPSGGIKVAHTLLGLICLSVIAHYCQFFHPLTGASLGILCSNSAAFFLLVTYGCFVTSTLLLISSLLSYFCASFLPKTAFEFAYHVTSCILYLSSSMNLLLSLVANIPQGTNFHEPGFDAKVAAAVLGLINSCLYGASSYFSYISLKQMS